MKKLLTFMLIGLFATLSYAQKIEEKDVPAPVKKAFKKYYPAAKGVKWDKEKANYEASFDMNKMDHSILMDASGNMLETEEEIAVATLPAAIAAYVKKNYPGKKITEASQITNAGGELMYEAEIKGMDLLFNSQGEFIKVAEEHGAKDED